jgi:hypothetical protein
MQSLLMRAAQGYGEFIADLAAQGFWLRKFKMVGIRRGLLADQAWLSADEQ